MAALQLGKSWKRSSHMRTHVHGHTCTEESCGTLKTKMLYPSISFCKAELPSSDGIQELFTKAELYNIGQIKKWALDHKKKIWNKIVFQGPQKSLLIFCCDRVGYLSGSFFLRNFQDHLVCVCEVILEPLSHVFVYSILYF